jgi:hypothetical protein
MRKIVVLTALLAAIACALFCPCQSDAQRDPSGHPLIIELDNKFIDDYANRATITSEYTITGISKDHPEKNDGEVHVGGWADAAGLPCVAEVMNVIHKGKKARDAFHKAFDAGTKVTVTGAWRIWGEHAGGGNQIQRVGPKPKGNLHGAPSNPDHVFEIHPVTTLKVDGVETDASKAIGEIPNFEPKDAHLAFTVHFEKVPCKIVPKGDRTRIITQSVQLNFTEFLIRPEKDVEEWKDGHAVICSVFDTDGELLVRNRRMVFIKGTAADTLAKDLKKDDVLHVVGFARIDLALVQWRLENNDKWKAESDEEKPLNWRLPYEMIIVSAKPFNKELLD